MKPIRWNYNFKQDLTPKRGRFDFQFLSSFKIYKLIFLILILAPTFCFSQDEAEKTGEGDSRYDFSLSYGAFLPFGLVGVRDNYPVGGFSIAHPFWFTTLEWSSHFFNASGVSFGQLGVTMRFLSQTNSLMDTYLGFGPEISRYQRIESEVTGKFPYFTRGAFHFIGGGMVPITDIISFRVNFKYSLMNPAHVLIATMGLNVQF